MQCNNLIVGFLFDTPPCSQATCPEMRASEWQFLCAVHDQPKSCCAIDYCCHTLDWAANVVTNPKIFPSRFTVLSEGHDRNAVQKNLVNVFRRLHRIFAHAWFQHRGVFWNIESQSGLYVFFKRVCDLNNLLPAENYKLPPEAEGLDPTPSEKEETQAKVTAIAKPPARDTGSNANDEDDHSNSLHARRSNTARHSSRPSTGSSVTTVIEEREDEHSDLSEKMRNIQISAPEIVEEDSEVEVPVIVEGEMLDDNSSATVQHPSEPRVDVQEMTAEDTDAAEIDPNTEDNLDNNVATTSQHDGLPETAKENTQKLTDLSLDDTDHVSHTQKDLVTESSKESSEKGSQPDPDEVLKASSQPADQISAEES
jgi:hypothetical protein